MEVEPQLTADEVEAMWASDQWNTEELAALAMAALDANQTRRVPPLKPTTD